jgi:hypothetical protein
VQYANSSTFVGGLNGTTGVFGNSTTASSSSNGTIVSSPSLTATYVGLIANAAGLIEIPWVATALGLMITATL